MLKDFLQNLISGSDKSIGLIVSSCRDDLKVIRRMAITEMMQHRHKYDFIIREHEIIINENITILFRVINDNDSVRGFGINEDAILRFNLSSTSIQLLNQALREQCKIFDMEKN